MDTHVPYPIGNPFWVTCTSFLKLYTRICVLLNHVYLFQIHTHWSHSFLTASCYFVLWLYHNFALCSFFFLFSSNSQWMLCVSFIMPQSLSKLQWKLWLSLQKNSHASEIFPFKLFSSLSSCPCNILLGCHGAHLEFLLCHYETLLIPLGFPVA